MKGQLYIDKAVKVLKQGGVVVFPTDTVWGIGALISSKEGIEKLYAIKGREKDKPTAVLVSDVHMANKYGVMDKAAWELAKKYWPGALTLVVKARGNEVSSLVRGGGKKVGLRAPNYQWVQALIKVAGEGIVAGSANFAGKPAPKRKQAIDKQLLSMVDLVVDGKGGGREASTVIDAAVKPVRVLRKGVIELVS